MSDFKVKVRNFAESSRHYLYLLSPCWFIISLSALLWLFFGLPQTTEALKIVEESEALTSNAFWAIGAYAFTSGYLSLALMSVTYPDRTDYLRPGRSRRENDSMDQVFVIISAILIGLVIPVRMIWVGVANDLPSIWSTSLVVIAIILSLVFVGKLDDGGDTENALDQLGRQTPPGTSASSDLQRTFGGMPIGPVSTGGTDDRSRLFGAKSEGQGTQQSPFTWKGTEQRSDLPQLKEIFTKISPIFYALMPWIKGPIRTFSILLRPFDKAGGGKWNERMPATIFGVCMFIILITLLMLVTFTADPVIAPQIAGPLTVILWATTGWIAFSSIVLVYWFRIFNLPSRLAFILLACLAWLFGNWNNNHTPCADCSALTTERPSFEGYAKNWVENREQLFGQIATGKIPVYVVAAAGGGIRAGYWTAATLTALENRAPGFSCHVLAISGVSGGALGAGAYAAALADYPNYRCDGQAVPSHDVSEAPLKMLSQDYLSPPLAGMLFADGVQRFNPLPFERAKLPDRARALEEAWEIGWQKSAQSDHFALPMLQLWQGEPGKGPIPALWLNGTVVENGYPITVSPVAIDRDPAFTETFDLLSNWRVDVPLSTAVNMSTRFPYISPAATIELEETQKQFRVVDGGYFDNSGAQVAMQIANAFKAAMGDQFDRFQVIPIIIINDTTRASQVDLTPESLAQTPLLGDDIDNTWSMAELGSPITTSVQTRNARGQSAELAFVREYGPDCSIVASISGREVALGWLLSDQSTKYMKQKADELHQDVDTNISSLISHKNAFGVTGVQCAQ